MWAPQLLHNKWTIHKHIAVKVIINLPETMTTSGLMMPTTSVQNTRRSGTLCSS